MNFDTKKVGVILWYKVTLTSINFKRAADSLLFISCYISKTLSEFFSILFYFITARCVFDDKLFKFENTDFKKAKKILSRIHIKLW